MRRAVTVLCTAALGFALTACPGPDNNVNAPSPSPSPPASLSPTPSATASPTSSPAAVRPNLIDKSQQWAGNTNANQPCGQRTEHYLNAVCGYGDHDKPPESACIDMAKAYANSQAAGVCGQQSGCQSPKACKINHVILGTPKPYVFEDIPPSACPNQTAGWSCRIDITYDCLCQ